MALTEALHLGALGPLLINAIAAGATVFVVLQLLDTIGLLNFQHDKLFSSAIAALAIVVTSAIALPMTGMEHSLHVWATIATFAGLVEASKGRAPSPVHFLALVLLPLIRFEGAAFAFAAIAALFAFGQRRLAILAAITILCSLGAYFWLMASRGLPLMPSSVMMKSAIVETAYEHSNPLRSVLRNLAFSAQSPEGQSLIMLGLAIGIGGWFIRADRKVLTVCAAVLAAIGAHLFFGAYNWFHRYEVYVIALSVCTLFYVGAQARPLLADSEWKVAKFVIVILALLASKPYITAAYVTPSAARNIYDQQYQMAIFAQQFYRHPVAVNDLGLVAYKNPQFVLDLFGLGSEAVRVAKMTGQYGPKKMSALASEHHVELVMIYDGWFPKGLPEDWKKVALLHTDQVTSASGDVAFYSTPLANAEELEKALNDFKSRLPQRDNLDIISR